MDSIQLFHESTKCLNPPIIIYMTVIHELSSTFVVRAMNFTKKSTIYYAAKPFETDTLGMLKVYRHVRQSASKGTLT